MAETAGPAGEPAARPERLVVGITGASGVQYGTAAVRLLAETDVETHVVVTSAGKRVMETETGDDMERIRGWADAVHGNADIGAPVASGSFAFDGMLVCPCSMKTLGYVANGIAEGLVARTAEVALKEGRRLVLVPREAPMASTHVANLRRADEAGAVIAPASPGFYTEPESIEELVDRFAAKLLDGFGVEVDAMARWSGDR